MSAAYLLASVGLAFKKRIVHLHTSTSLPTPSRVKAELAREPMRQICLRPAMILYAHAHLSLVDKTACSSYLRSKGYRVIEEGTDSIAFL
jgi:hypothetical protein